MIDRLQFLQFVIKIIARACVCVCMYVRAERKRDVHLYEKRSVIVVKQWPKQAPMTCQATAMRRHLILPRKALPV